MSTVGIMVRVKSVHPWGCRCIEMFSGSMVDYTKIQLHDMKASGRIRSVFMTKGKIVTILPDVSKPTAGIMSKEIMLCAGS